MYPGHRLTHFPRCTYSKSRFIRLGHGARADFICPLSFTGEEVLYASRPCPLASLVLLILPVPARGIKRTVFHRRVNRFFLSTWVCPKSLYNAALPSCFVTHGFFHTSRFPFPSQRCKYSWDTCLVSILSHQEQLRACRSFIAY